MWLERYKFISEFIPPNSNILEFGAGRQHILKFIKPKTYYPFDKKEMDLNLSFPIIREPIDIVLAVGLIEYLDDPLSFLKTIKHYSSKAIVTYNGGNYAKFKNHLSQAEFQNLLKETQWQFNLLGQSQASTIYSLRGIRLL